MEINASIYIPPRTNGDGMENPDDQLEEILATKTGRLSLGDKLLYRPDSLVSFTSSPAPVIPSGQVVYLKPQAVQQSIKNGSFKSMKEPKFVPYEPYKAAVNPIVPVVKKERRKSTRRSLIEPNLSSVETVSIASKDDVSSIPDVDKTDLQSEIENLKLQNAELDKQLKFQVKVNTELKSMLVAAVGEDLEVRVQHLTEDKLQLAHALLNSAQNLSSHQEQLEWLVGQCEVWRSKFLASSLMLEELARSSALLHHRAQDLQNVMKEMLSEKNTARESILKSVRNLQVLRENFDPASGLLLATSPHRTESIQSSINSVLAGDNLTIAAWCQHLSECLAERLLGPAAPSIIQSSLPAPSDPGTPAEIKAMDLLQRSADIQGALPDIACNAVVGAAAALGGGLFPHIGCTPTTCCSHCSGEMKTL